MRDRRPDEIDALKAVGSVAFDVTSTYRVVYANNRTTNVVDCERVEWDSDSRLYHAVDDTDVRAIRVREDERSLVKTEDEEQDVLVTVEREMQAPYEQYVYGGSASTTKTYVRFVGPYTGRGLLPAYKSETKVRVNDCVLRGEGDSVTSEWSWETVDAGRAAFVESSDQLADGFNAQTCLAVGFDNPITDVQLVQDML